MNLLDIYYKSPIFLQNIFTSLQGYRNSMVRYSHEYNHALKEFSSRDYSNLEELEEYQNSRVRELVKFAFENSPFYRKFYKDIDIDSINTVEDLKQLPILDKELVRENIDDFYTIMPKYAEVSNTSGTTGKSIKFYYTKFDIQRRMAYLDHFKMQHGFIHRKMKKASFTSAKVIPGNQKSKIYWRNNISVRQRIYSGFHCKGDAAKYFVDDLNIYKPHSIDGYPSALYEMAKYIVNNDVKLKFAPIAIFPTAEPLLPHYRELIEKAFGCPVRDQYASSEGAPFITECKCGKLHYCMDTGVIEFDQDGEMIVTCFETHGSPLIRYKIGDRAFLSHETNCDCGCVMPIVDRIEGRTLDFVYTQDKQKVTAVYLSLVSGDFLNSMKAMQFVQNDFTSVDVYIETDDAYTEDMKQIIIDKLHYSLGIKMEIRVHIVDEIKKDKSGKFKFIINNVDNQ